MFPYEKCICVVCLGAFGISTIQHSVPGKILDPKNLHSHHKIPAANSLYSPAAVLNGMSISASVMPSDTA